MYLWHCSMDMFIVNLRESWYMVLMQFYECLQGSVEL